ncbi:MAG: carboxypeptidase regulatory-like domain-containing protein [Acidobacteria bacterium]|nr:carboxypeptidase regulatory-like domain-containing protein [Acidobacteriota bacterium]
MTRRALVGFVLFAAVASAAKKKDKSKKGGPLGLVSGTVFTSDGLSIPGAKVTVVSKADGKTKLEAISSQRGEFSIRTPADEDLATGLEYVVRAEAKGFEPAEKTVEVYQAQRTNLNLLLDPKK